MIGPVAAALRRTSGDFHGRPTLRLANETLAVEVLAEAGPRIVGLRHDDSDNLLAETPEIGWQTAFGTYELFGGHRMWIAPEDADRVAVPDSDGLDVESLVDGLRLSGGIEPSTGCVRSMDVRLDHVPPSMTVVHRSAMGSP